jgi:hypothetical protein
VYKEEDRLLYVISAKSEITWSSFKEIFDSLYTSAAHLGEFDLDSLPYRRLETMRAIEALGHCDFFFGGKGNKVCVTPPVLARLPFAGLPQAVLAGARSPQTVDQLAEFCSVFDGHVRLSIQHSVPDSVLIPSRIIVEAESARQLEDISEACAIRFSAEPPAWSISQFVGLLDDYLSSLDWSAGEEINWRRKDFDVSLLQFRTASAEYGRVRLSSYDDRVRNQRIHLLWRDGSFARVDRDWGRYAALRCAGVNVLTYDAPQLRLAVPVGAPLPRLFARALALCSGLPARFVSRKKMSPEHTVPDSWGFTCFESVPPQIAGIVANKLGQELLRGPVDR